MLTKESSKNTVLFPSQLISQYQVLCVGWLIKQPQFQTSRGVVLRRGAQVELALADGSLKETPLDGFKTVKPIVFCQQLTKIFKKRTLEN